jgi:hypothetical protein
MRYFYPLNIVPIQKEGVCLVTNGVKRSRSAPHESRREGDQRRQREWRKKNWVRYRATTKAWRQRNKDKRRIQRLEYHRRNRSVLHDVRNCRKSWTPANIRAIHATGRLNDRALSRLLGRSMKAIQMKRRKTRKSKCRKATK